MSADDMRVSVVIPAFNNVELTRRCVAALLAATPPELLAEVVVVDDASTDGVSAAWTAARTGVVPLLLERNHGFSGACNAGAARCTGDAIFFLNNDAFATPGSIAALRDALHGDPAVGIVGARLLYADGTLQHAGMAPLPGSVGAWWHPYKHLDGTLAAANVACDYLAVTGAALLVRRELFVRLRGFDRGFVNGWEDVDLCLRAWCAGARVRYEPRAVLEHLESATIGRPANNAANMRRLHDRWEPLLRDAPRYPLPEVPPIALAVDVAAAQADGDAWALEHVRHWWGAALGAAVTPVRPGARYDRAGVDFRAALARRLPTLEVAWGNACLAAPTGSRRAALVAPRSADEALAFARARAVDAWWAPTAAARDALLSAGCPPERVSLVALGAAPAEPTRRSGLPVIATAAPETVAADLARRGIAARCVPLTAGRRPNLASVDIVVAAEVADPWGLLAAAARANGCRVVGAPNTAREPLLRELAASAGAVGELRAQAPERAREARRRGDAVLATKRAAELARALTGGVPPASAVTVDPAFAARLRGARYGGEINVS